jgi:hypothetical protein
MATKLAIDDALLNEAFRIGDKKTKRQVVEVALREFIQRRQRLAVVKLFGKVDYDPSYDYKRERRAGRKPNA